MPVDVLPWRSAGDGEAFREPRRGRDARDERLAVREADAPDRDVAPRALPEPRLHRPGSRHARAAARGESDRAAAGPDPMPVHTTHPLFAENKIRFFVDPWPWIDALRSADFAFGTRIHGNIAALLAGIPSYVLTHRSADARARPLFRDPAPADARVAPDTDAATLYAEADYTGLVRGHAARLPGLHRLPDRPPAWTTSSPRPGAERIRPHGRRDRLPARHRGQCGPPGQDRHPPTQAPRLPGPPVGADPLEPRDRRPARPPRERDRRRGASEDDPGS